MLSYWVISNTTPACVLEPPEGVVPYRFPFESKTRFEEGWVPSPPVDEKR